MRKSEQAKRTVSCKDAVCISLR